jgi:hypothetical protein
MISACLRFPGVRIIAATSLSVVTGTFLAALNLDHRRAVPGITAGRRVTTSGPGKGAAIMGRVVLVGVGVIVTLAGVVFTLQGVGVLGGSAMSGVTFWAVAGPVIVLAGLAIAAIGLRRGLARSSLR